MLVSIKSLGLLVLFAFGLNLAICTLVSVSFFTVFHIHVSYSIISSTHNVHQMIFQTNCPVNVLGWSPAHIWGED